MKSNIFTALDGSGMRIAVVAARFNQEPTDAMTTDCVDALRACGVDDVNIVTVRVPGSFELPVAAAILAAQHEFDAIICLGVLIKGDTKHDEYIANACANGITRISIDYKIPVLFGVLTTENREQAEVRSLGGQKKGWEAGMSAIETVLAMRNVAK
jgi:6,7-dimethyl-8-ribityllumazine synthase